jgi:hypothetical protein
MKTEYTKETSEKETVFRSRHFAIKRAERAVASRVAMRVIGSLGEQQLVELADAIERVDGAQRELSRLVNEAAGRLFQ